ncbi:diguanylate cyclase/phosphodiesterase (GGDEF & EAL domains) with PAS/PAC sensor(s), partial [hydrothermal vent metagenome]
YHITAVAHTHISLDELFKSIHEALAPILNVQNFYIALYDETSDMVNVAYFVDRYDKSPGLYKAKKGLTEFVIQSNDSQLLTHSQLLSYLNQGTIDVQGTLPQVWLGVPLQLQGKAIGALVVQSYEYSSAYSEQDAQFLTFVSEQIAIVIERKQAEERQSDLSTELRQQTRAMYRAQKMESLGILAGGIAHDFNNLLVAMINQTSLAQTYVADDHPSYIHIGKAVQAAEKAASLTQQLLAYSGSGQFSIKPISLNDLIQENIDLLKVAMPKQIVWDLAIENDTPLIDADLAQLQQVVMNLLINAAEAVGEQVGTIQVQTAVRHITPKDDTFWRYTGNELPAGAYVSLRVQDSGRGMDSKTISKIFDPFFTTKFTGRGLGLAAVLGIVRSHHGGLQVSSKAGKGTAFDLLFPISENSTTSSDPEAIDEGSATGGVVLIIDDEAAVRETVSDVLELEGIDVLTAVNGKKGVATYKEHIDSVDLVLLDLSMPGLSGQETFAKLQTLDPNVRILLSSGYSETDATRGFDSPPLVDFIQKPYRLNTFLHLIRKHIKKK